MPNRTCQVPSPEQKRFMEIRDASERAMIARIVNAVDAAAADMASEVKRAGIGIPAAKRDYFTFAAQQILFVRLCGGDPETLEGGDPEIGERIIGNARHIVNLWKMHGSA